MLSFNKHLNGIDYFKIFHNTESAHIVIKIASLSKPNSKQSVVMHRV